MILNLWGTGNQHACFSVTRAIRASSHNFGDRLICDVRLFVLHLTPCSFSYLCQWRSQDLKVGYSRPTEKEVHGEKLQFTVHNMFTESWVGHRDWDWDWDSGCWYSTIFPNWRIRDPAGQGLAARCLRSRECGTRAGRPSWLLATWPHAPLDHDLCHCWAVKPPRRPGPHRLTGPSTLRASGRRPPNRVPRRRGWGAVVRVSSCACAGTHKTERGGCKRRRVKGDQACALRPACQPVRDANRGLMGRRWRSGPVCWDGDAKERLDGLFWDWRNRI
jgi:hypothetical protein